MNGVGDKLEEMTYKPKTGGNAKAGSWANKCTSWFSTLDMGDYVTDLALAPKEMGNGKDFFAELRKQVASLMEKEKAGG